MERLHGAVASLIGLVVISGLLLLAGYIAVRLIRWAVVTIRRP
jgi:hypothetical protein